ncbi:hypothetical protein EIP91_011964 [Steccherinum ochraceum]|uniref:Uncharacterized protein n=1 Tax=Steccherinum ochraceum TaxID=92696 RepID=A0A4R0RVC1_9APHY|nr:hypothetical protein EIP91_011964 [Steccherinum ochraceum]
MSRPSWISLQGERIVPSVYQGRYNVVHRRVELELISCLPRSPAASSLDAIAHTSQSGTTGITLGSRYDIEGHTDKVFQRNYWNVHYFKALDIARAAYDEARVVMAEAALRWLTHQSASQQELGDAVTNEASSAWVNDEVLIRDSRRCGTRLRLYEEGLAILRLKTSHIICT